VGPQKVMLRLSMICLFDSFVNLMDYP
jgi:hypothetical protein